MGRFKSRGAEKIAPASFDLATLTSESLDFVAKLTPSFGGNGRHYFDFSFLINHKWSLCHLSKLENHFLQAHTDMHIVVTFARHVVKMRDPGIQNILTKLCQLHALHRIQLNAGQFITVRLLLLFHALLRARLNPGQFVMVSIVRSFTQIGNFPDFIFCWARMKAIKHSIYLQMFLMLNVSILCSDRCYDN